MRTFGDLSMSIELKTTATIPVYCIGLPGDTAFTLAVDGTGFYYSVADYDGVKPIWFKVPATTLPFPPPPPPPPPVPQFPTITFRVDTANTTQCSNGICTTSCIKTLHWDTTDATSVTLEGNNVSVNGTRQFRSGAVDQTFIMNFTVTGPVGTLTKAYTINVPANYRYSQPIPKPKEIND